MKIDKEFEKNLTGSIFAGLMVGIGVIVNTQCDNRYMGAFMFSIALLTIIRYKLPLYTGRIGFLKNSVGQFALMLLMNCVGSMGALLMQLEISDKYQQALLLMFVKGIGCGILMFLAVKTKDPFFTVMCIMVFILSGFEHCIADFPSLVTHFSGANLIKWLAVVAGNSIGSIVTMWVIREE